MLPICHMHSMLPRLGHNKTFTYMRENLWKNMTSGGRSLCVSLATSTTQSYEPLKPLSVLQPSWPQISVDLMELCPEPRTLLDEFDRSHVIMDHPTITERGRPTRQDCIAKGITDFLYHRVDNSQIVANEALSNDDMLLPVQCYQKTKWLIEIKLGSLSMCQPQTQGVIGQAEHSFASLSGIFLESILHRWTFELSGIKYVIINSPRFETLGRWPVGLKCTPVPDCVLVSLYGLRAQNLLLWYYWSAAYDACLAVRPSRVTPTISTPECEAHKSDPKHIVVSSTRGTTAEEATLQIDLPYEMRWHGTHTMFNMSLLNVHILPGDRPWPVASSQRVMILRPGNDDWPVKKIAEHNRTLNADQAALGITWKSRKHTLEPLHVVRHREVLVQYYKPLTIQSVNELPRKGIADEEEQIHLFATEMSKSARLHASEPQHSQPLYQDDYCPQSLTRILVLGIQLYYHLPGVRTSVLTYSMTTINPPNRLSRHFRLQLSGLHIHPSLKAVYGIQLELGIRLLCSIATPTSLPKSGEDTADGEWVLLLVYTCNY